VNKKAADTCPAAWRAIEKENGHGTWRVPVAVKKVRNLYLRTGTLRQGIPTPPDSVTPLILGKLLGVLINMCKQSFSFIRISLTTQESVSRLG
jgi:hypothetical protein